MSPKLKEARQLLSKRLEEIDGERRQLLAALEQLDQIGTDKPAPRASTGRKRTAAPNASRRRSSNRGHKRAPRGKREQQLLSSLAEHPDFRVSEHARQVGVKPQQLYPILGRLLERKQIVKKDHGYALQST